MLCLITALALLSQAPAAPVARLPLEGARAMAFVGAIDLDRARAFYAGVLGLKVISQDQLAVVVDAGGVRVRINRPLNNVVTADYTVLGFETPHIVEAVKALTAKGVSFMHLSFLGAAQDELGIWTAPNGDRVAWFRDPDGNLLSISDDVSGRS